VVLFSAFAFGNDGNPQERVHNSRSSEQRFNQALPEYQMGQPTTTSRDDLSFTVIDPVSQIA
jgi:hypothetical protein